MKLTVKINAKRYTAFAFDINNQKLRRIWNKNSFSQIISLNRCDTVLQIKCTWVIFRIFFRIINQNIAKRQICIAPNTVHIFIDNILCFSVILIKNSFTGRIKIFISVFFIIILRITRPKAVLVNCNPLLFKIAEYESAHSSVAYR